MHVKIAETVLMKYFIAIQVKQGRLYNLNLYFLTMFISISSHSQKKKKKLATACFKYYVTICMLYRYLFKIWV